MPNPVLPNAWICLETIEDCVNACDCSDKAAALECIEILKTIIFANCKGYFSKISTGGNCPTGYPRVPTG